MSVERPDDETVGRLMAEHDQLVEEIEALVGELGQALQIFRKDRKHGQIASLRVILAYLRGIGVEARLRTPLYELQAKLEGINKKSLDLATAAFAVDQLHKSGKTIPEAIGEVCNATGSKISHAALMNFRKNLSSTRGAKRGVVVKRVNKWAVQHYDFVISAASKSGLSPQQLADVALERVRNAFGK